MGSFLQALGSLGENVGDAGQLRKQNKIQQGQFQDQKTRTALEGRRVKNEDLRLLLEKQAAIDRQKTDDLNRQRLKQDIEGYGWKEAIPVQQGDRYLQINTVTGARREIPKEEFQALGNKGKKQGWDIKQTKSGEFEYLPKDPTMGDKPIGSGIIGKLARAGTGTGTGGSSDVAAVVQAIADGKQPPVTTGLYRNTLAVRAGLARKGYDLATAQEDWTATQRYLASLNGPQQLRLRQAISTASDGLDKIEGLYKEWQALGPRSGVKFFNHGALLAARNLPGRAGAVAQALDTQIADLTSELGQVYMGGNSSTDKALDLAAKNLSSDWNKETFEEGLKQARANIRIRKNSISLGLPAGVGTEYAPKRGVSSDDPDDPVNKLLKKYNLK